MHVNMIFHQAYGQSYQESNTLQRGCYTVTQFNSKLQQKRKCVQADVHMHWETKVEQYEVNLRLIPSRRMTLSGVTGPSCYFLLFIHNMFILFSGNACSQSVMSIACHLFSSLCIFMQTHALGLYFLLGCTAERNQISRSGLPNNCRHHETSFYQLPFNFALHMLE